MNSNLFKQPHAFIDIETLGLTTDSPLLEVSVAVFDLKNEPNYAELVGEAISFPFNVGEQFKTMRRVPDASTLLWWMTDASKARNEVMTRSLNCKEHNGTTLQSLASLLCGVEHIWCRGPHFDAALLESLAADYDLRKMWDYWKIRDIRTLLFTLDKEDDAKKYKAEMEKSGEFVKHDSAHDVAIDAYLVATYLREHFSREYNDAAAQRKRVKAR